jgi:hypothetical protein
VVAPAAFHRIATGARKRANQHEREVQKGLGVAGDSEFDAVVEVVAADDLVEFLPGQFGRGRPLVSCHIPERDLDQG